MMDYSKMSDFEVNKMVSAYLWGSVCSVDGVVLHNEKDGPFDPCNSWADAGPIIEKHNISLLCSTMRSQKVWEAMTPDGEEHCWAETNPLRAAMIVYLMMHDKGEE